MSWQNRTRKSESSTSSFKKTASKSKSWRLPTTIAHRLTINRKISGSATLGLFIFTLASVTWLIYLTTWYAPISNPVWTIVAESYATNLMVPHNVPSVNSATKLAELIEKSNGLSDSSQPEIQSSNGELVLETLDSLLIRIKKDQKKSGSKRYYLYEITAHGLVDDHGPFLLKDWAANKIEGMAPPQEKDKIRIKELLQLVVESAGGHPAAVILNCETADAFEELGIWGNQFSESILEMEPWIETQPNLTVILTTQKSQINCIDSKVTESLFGRIWREELTDGSELGNIFTLLDLHQKVADKVAKEAIERFGLIQQPVLLPIGKSGELRASQIKLVSLKPASRITSDFLTKQNISTWKERLGLDSEPVNSAESTTRDRQALEESITEMWNEYEKVSNIKPHPLSFKPNAWAVFKAAVLRFEGLTINKNYYSASKIKIEIAKLKAKIEKSIPVNKVSINPSLAISEFYLRDQDKEPPQWLVTAFDYQWKKPGLDIAKAIDSFNEEYDKRRSTISTTASNTIKKDKPDISSNNELQKQDRIEKPGTLTANDKNQNAELKKPKENPTSEVASKTSTSSSNSDVKGSTSKNLNPESPVSEVKPEDKKSVGENVQGNKGGLTPTVKPNKKLVSTPEMKFWLLHLILGKIRSESISDIKYPLDWANHVVTSNEVLPLELHIIALASKDLFKIGVDKYKRLAQESIFSFVDLVVSSERSFAGLTDTFGSPSTFFNHTYYWVKPWNDIADNSFRKSWDHIFSNDESLRNQGTIIQRDASLQFKSLLSRSTRIQKTLKTYYLALERLPELSFWMVHSHLIDYTNDIHKSTPQEFTDISMAWNCIHSISRMLENEKNYNISLDEREKIIRDLETKASSLDLLLESMEKHYSLICRNLINHSEGRDVDPITFMLFRHAMRIPPKDIQLRNNLIKSYYTLNDRVELKRTAVANTISSSDLFELSNYFCQRVEELKYDLVDDQSIISRYNPAEIKKLRADMNSNINHPLYTSRLLESKVETLIQKVYNSSNDIDTSVTWPLVRLVRVLPLSMIHNTDDPIISHIQSIFTSDHFLLFAKRVWDSHWGALNESAKPYYMDLSFSLLEEAKRIAPSSVSKSGSFTEIDNLLKSPCLPDIRIPTDIYVNGSPDFKLPLTIHPEKSDRYPDGFATIMIANDNPFEYDQRITSNYKAFLNSPMDLSMQMHDKTWKDSEHSILRMPTISKSNLKVGFLFRGNYQEKEVSVHSTDIPDWREFQTLPPSGGSLALRCDPKLLSRLGRTGGNVTFLLDCSGSMGVSPGVEWSASAKYAQAVESLIETVSHLPDGTNISVWVFGEAVGDLKSADPEKTIREVVPFTRLDSTDTGSLKRIRQLISYPACEPWNKSPVIQAMEQAKTSLMTQDGPKAMVVITDGQDNVYGRNLNQDAPRKKNSQSENQKTDFTKAIRSIFAETGISVNVVGYKLASEELNVVEQQFAVVRDLSVAGVFTLVNEPNDLFEALESILRRKLVYRFESQGSKPVRPENITGTEIQPNDSAIQWASPSLSEDVYKIWMDIGQRVESKALVQNGKRQLFKLVQDNPEVKPVILRDSWIKSNFSWRPQVTAQGWTLSWIGNKFSGSDLEMLVAIEKEISSDPMTSDAITIDPEPSDISLVIKPLDQSGKKFNGNIRRMWNYPSNVWKITIYNWNESRLIPSIQCDIQLGRAFDSVLTLFAGKDYVRESDLNGLTFHSQNKDVHIEYFEKAMRLVPDENFQKFVRKPCWVIRTKQDKPAVMRADLEFNDSIPKLTEYRYFHDSGIYETIIWPSGESTTLESLTTPTSIQFRPIHQKLNSPASSTIRLDLVNNLPIPTDKDPWPLPVELPSDNLSNPLNGSQRDRLPPALGSESPPAPDPIFQKPPQPN